MWEENHESTTQQEIWEEAILEAVFSFIVSRISQAGINGQFRVYKQCFEAEIPAWQRRQLVIGLHRNSSFNPNPNPNQALATTLICNCVKIVFCSSVLLSPFI